MNKDFFITGGTGLIGRALMRQLLPNVEALKIASMKMRWAKSECSILNINMRSSMQLQC